MAPRDSTNRPYRSAEQERARSIIDQVHELITELKTLVLDGNNTNDEHGNTVLQKWDFTVPSRSSK